MFLTFLNKKDYRRITDLNMVESTLCERIRYEFMYKTNNVLCDSAQWNEDNREKIYVIYFDGYRFACQSNENENLFIQNEFTYDIVDGNYKQLSDRLKRIDNSFIKLKKNYIKKFGC